MQQFRNESTESTGVEQRGPRSKRIPRFLGRLCMNDQAENPAHGAATVIAIDMDDMPIAMVSEGIIDSTRSEQSRAFKQYVLQLADIASDQGRVAKDVAALFDGWDPDYLTKDRVAQREQTAGRPTNQD